VLNQKVDGLGLRTIGNMDLTGRWVRQHLKGSRADQLRHVFLLSRSIAIALLNPGTSSYAESVTTDFVEYTFLPRTPWPRSLAAETVLQLYLLWRRSSHSDHSSKRVQSKA